LYENVQVMISSKKEGETFEVIESALGDKAAALLQQWSSTWIMTGTARAVVRDEHGVP
jgi:hypothetical protein